MRRLGLLWPSTGFERKELTLTLHVPRWEEKIPLAKTTLEKTWLFHEIGRCYLELDQAWQAQHYGEKSQQCAEEEGDIEWQLNASVLVAQAQGMGTERGPPYLSQPSGRAARPGLGTLSIPVCPWPDECGLRVEDKALHPDQCVVSAFFKPRSVRARGTRSPAAHQHSIASSEQRHFL